MGQEDYLNNLLNSIVDEKEESDKSKNKEEKELLVDFFANEEEEPLMNVFANEEEESLMDVFANEEEEPLMDVFANEKEESLMDVFANEEEEPLMDVFANEEEEPLMDVFANQEEGSSEDVFTYEEETFEGNEDINNEEIDTEQESDSLLNSIDDILGSLDEIQEEDVFDRIEKESDESKDEDIFSILGETEESIDYESSASDSTKQSLFDDDLMKLLGEEDFSGEEVFLSADETEAELAKDKDIKEQETKNGKNNKKPGLFSKLFKGKEDNKTSDNNDQPLVDIEPKEKKKKEKKTKPPKEKKAKKEKKPKIEKVKKPEIIEEASVPLHKGQVVAIFILCISIAIFIVSGSNLVPYSISISTAKGYYEREEYTKAYYEIEGLKINNKDLTFYNKLETIMYLKNQLDSYYTYERIGLNQEALSSLLKGVSKYDEHYIQAQQYDVVSYYDRVLGQIENELAEKYNVTLEMARTINLAEDANSYSAQINNITNEH